MVINIFLICCSYEHYNKLYGGFFDEAIYNEDIFQGNLVINRNEPSLLIRWLKKTYHLIIKERGMPSKFASIYFIK